MTDAVGVGRIYRCDCDAVKEAHADNGVYSFFRSSNSLLTAACRYEKGTWSGCVNQMMTRIDNLKANSDATCEKTRRLTKRCKQETNTKKSAKGNCNYSLMSIKTGRKRARERERGDGGIKQRSHPQYFDFSLQAKGRTRSRASSNHPPIFNRLL